MYEQTWLRYTRTGGHLVRNTTALKDFSKDETEQCQLSKIFNHHKT
jgi:hypothetical protein